MSIIDTIYEALSNKGRKVKQTAQNLYDTYNTIANFPEMQFIKDTNQFKRLASINVDNNIGPAFEAVVKAENAIPKHIYNDGSISMPHRASYYNELIKAADNYNAALEKRGNNGWPADYRDDPDKSMRGKYNWHDWVRYQEFYDPNDENSVPFVYGRVDASEKGNKVREKGAYTPQERGFVGVETGANLIRQMNNLAKQYDKIGEVKKQVWQKWHALDSNGLGNTKEAKDYFDARTKLDDKYYDTLRQLRRARDAYSEYVGTFRNM